MLSNLGVFCKFSLQPSQMSKDMSKNMGKYENSLYSLDWVEGKVHRTIGFAVDVPTKKVNSTWTNLNLGICQNMEQHVFHGGTTVWKNVGNHGSIFRAIFDTIRSDVSLHAGMTMHCKGFLRCNQRSCSMHGILWTRFMLH